MNTKDLKILVCGSAGSGKTSILRRITEDTFTDEYIPTLFHSQTLHTVTTKNGKSIRIIFLDTDGKRSYEKYSSPFFYGIVAGIVVYDISDQTSVESVKEAFENFQAYCEDVRTVLVGNKCDKERSVDRTDMEEFARKQKSLHFETSAKTNTNVKEMIMSILDQLVQTNGNQKYETVEKHQTVKTSQTGEKVQTVETHQMVQKSETSSCCVIS